MLAASDPPIASTPISPFLDAHAFRSTSTTPARSDSEMAICLDDSRARKVLGYAPAVPTVSAHELRAIAQGFQNDLIW